MTVTTTPATDRPRQLARLRENSAPKPHRLFRRATWERLATLAVTWLFGLPAALVIRLVSPLVVIRVGEIGTGRIGHILPAADLYLCDMAEWRGRRPVDLIYFSGMPVNAAAVAMVRRRIRPRNWARFIAGPNAWLPGAARHQITIRYFDNDGIRGRVGPQFDLDPNWIEQGDAWLESLGVSKNQRVVLISNRDQAHLDKIHPAMDWRYHDYRNSSIGTMLPMAEHFAAKGYAVIRVGADVAEPLHSSSPGVIDYAWSHRTPERDLYLGARCRFFIGNPSGISELAVVFRKPFGAVNVAPFMTILRIGDQPIYFHNGLWMPKRLRRKSDGRYLTVQEILAAGVQDSYSAQAYEQAGLELVENSADEILAFANELDQRLDGRFAISAEDTAVDNAFWQAVQPALGSGSSCGHTPIALSFLKRSPSIVDPVLELR